LKFQIQQEQKMRCKNLTIGWISVVYAVLMWSGPTQAIAASRLETEGGTLDGIYQCKATTESSTHDTYLTLNGKSDGKTIYLIAAHTPEPQAIGGYGVGRISGKKFVGSTSDGKKFDFDIALGSSDGDAAYETVTLKGTAGLKTLANVLVNAHLICHRLW
jgi:hypothetical protein